MFDVPDLGNLMLEKRLIPKHFPNSGNVSGFPVNILNNARLPLPFEDRSGNNRTQYQLIVHVYSYSVHRIEPNILSRVRYIVPR